MVLSESLVAFWHSLPFLTTARIFLQLSLLSFKIGLVALLLHYCYYQFVWKRFFSVSPRPFDQYLKERAQTIGVSDKEEIMRATLTIPSVVKTGPDENTSIEKFLSSVRLFTYLEPIISEQVASAAEEVPVSAGQSLPTGCVDDGELPYIFILRKGSFKVSSPAVGEESVVLNQPGDFLTSLFEVIGLVSGARDCELFAKRVTALEDSRVVRIPGNVIKELSLGKPTEAYNSVRIILTRFTRIICSSLFSHFGLSQELFRIDQILSVAETQRTPPSSTDSKTILLDTLFRRLGFAEDQWDKFYRSVDMVSDLKLVHVSEASTLQVEGLFLVVSGRVNVCLDGSKECRIFGPRSLFGSACSVVGSRAVSNCTALEPATLMHLSQAAVMRLFDKEPKFYLEMAKMILPKLSPFLGFLDMNLEWLHVNAGSAICEAGSKADSLYIVIHGRLRAATPGAQSRILAEIGPGQSYGESELFQDLSWEGTLFAVRDSELVRVPKDLFDILVRTNLETSVKMAKIIAGRQRACEMMGAGPRIATIKTLAILPSNVNAVPLAEIFCKRLFSVINQTESCTVLTKSSVITELGKHTFTAFGKLKLLEWCNMQEDMHRIIIYFADTPTSPWTQRCIRQADCVFIIADARDEPCLGEYEHQLRVTPNIVREELILVHQNHHCPSGLTRKWLDPRPWIHQHHHIMLRSSSEQQEQQVKGKGHQWKVPDMNWVILADQLMTQGFRRTLRSFYSPRGEVDYSMQDIERISRRVLGTAVGLVLGGGGARGISHIGVVKKLVQEGIPVDAIGGTSIGALVGGLYARDSNIYTSTALLRVFSALMSSKWRLAYDLTYPFCSWFTGESFNRALWKIFQERLIEDMWIPFFCITTDITKSKMMVHKEALAWRYIRASMSLSGFLPPLWNEGNSLLLDGGYTNNLPVDVMLSENASISKVIAVDVSSERIGTDDYYHDEVSGVWLLLRQIFGFKISVPNLTDIQSRLAYVSCMERIKEVKQLATNPAVSGIYYLRPPVQAFSTLEFDKFDKIHGIGEAYAAEIISEWRLNGTLETLKAETMAACAQNDLKQTDSIDLEEDADQEASRKACIRRRRRSL